MMIVLPIRTITDDERTNELFNKLPIEIQDYILNASDSLQQRAIIPLLESSEVDFPKKFEEGAVHLGNHVIQIGSLLAEKERMYPNLLNDLLEFNMNSFKIITEGFDNLPDNVTFGIANVLEILTDYMILTNDPKTAECITKPEYEPAIGFYLYLLLSISALISIFKYENKNYEQKINILLQYCNNYAKELEEYTETMEIESNSEDMKRVEKIKTC